MHKTVAALFLSLTLAAPTLAQHAGQDHGEGMVEARGTINAIGPEAVNITHDPIPEIGWPAMTMDIKVLEGADIGDVNPGDTAIFALEKDAGGLYGIVALRPAD